MKVLIIDHDDSFTHLLGQLIGQITGVMPTIINQRNSSIKDIEALNPSHIVLSPGPGTVENENDFGIGYEVLKHFDKKIPILGVCLGHQGIAKYYGANIEHAPKVMHGKQSLIQHKEESIFKNIKNPLKVMRYHSLCITNPPEELIILAKTDDTIMAVKHKSRPVYGIQFHPESIGTEEGEKLIRNFLNI